MPIRLPQPDWDQPAGAMPQPDQMEPEAQDADIVAGSFWSQRWPAICTLGAVFLWSALLVCQRLGLAPQLALDAAINHILTWSGPAALIVLVYLATARSGQHEATRFAQMARLLRTESQELDSRLMSVNRELSLAREFLAAQARDVDALGRSAAERISAHAKALEGLVQDNAASVQQLGSVSAVAVENMEQLRANLPVINTSAKDMASNLANVGRVAQAHLQDMVKGMTRLNDFGQASERQVVSLRGRIEEALAALEARSSQLDMLITGRFDALDERSSGFALDLERQESEAREALRARAAALGDELATNASRLDEQEAQALASLRARINALRDEGGALARALREGESGALADWQAQLARLSEKLGEFDADLSERHRRAIENAAKLGAQTEATTLRLAQAEARIEALTLADNSVAAAMETRLDTLERRLHETDQALERLTDSSVRLLEIIQSSAQQSREELPKALALGAEKLSEHEARVSALHEALGASGETSASLAQQADQTRQSLMAAREIMAGLNSALQQDFAQQIDTQGQAIGQLRDQLTQAHDQAHALANQAQGEWQIALGELSQAAQQAISALENDGAPRVKALAQELADTSGAALERSMRLKASELAGKLEQAAAHASGISAEAANQLLATLEAVAKQTNLLEARIASAREAAQDKVDHDFTRRMAMITDALQSVSVDIAGALDSEVTDTAWAGYLRGDRGIFTRRAVRLLSASEARQIHSLYEQDESFSSAVNRYIHDFEAMLRHVLATRDGHAISVTLLSSDVGKLYVALAQAIERLRA